MKSVPFLPWICSTRAGTCSISSILSASTTLVTARRQKTALSQEKPPTPRKQLIGRGARYYPFVIGDTTEEKYTRKFDENENNELRVIEQLHYHSANNPRYISELKQVLRESGIFDDQNLEERELKLKESFKKTRTYTDGVVWMNKRLSLRATPGTASRKVCLMPTFIPQSFEVKLPTHGVRDIEAFDEATYVSGSVRSSDLQIWQGYRQEYLSSMAINRNKKFTFENLQNAFVGISSLCRISSTCFQILMCESNVSIK
jgi:type III restriction enzyme